MVIVVIIQGPKLISWGVYDDESDLEPSVSGICTLGVMRCVHT